MKDMVLNERGSIDFEFEDFWSEYSNLLCVCFFDGAPELNSVHRIRVRVEDYR